jgi:anti-sigma regulatory factor (Ser/Thr protein kinase)
VDVVKRSAAQPWPGGEPWRARTHSSLSGGLHLEVHEPSQVGGARRAVATLARQLGLSDDDAGAASLAVTELATNLVRHGGGGEIALWWSPDSSGEPMIELVVMDSGPGMADVARSFGDGYSTSGTAGSGLGSVRRAARELDAWSHPRRGTVLWLRLGRRQPGVAPGRFAIGALTTPRPGQECFGDAWAVVEREGVLTALVVDGVGHGPQAADASRLAVAHFYDHPGETPEETMAGVHEALGGSRGAVAGVARLDPAAGTLRWAAVGNIAGLLVAPGGGTVRRFVSHNGTLGHAADRIQGFEHACPPGSVLVLHSDGVATSWSLDDYPGLAARHPAVIAGVLHRDHRRGRDDATVLVVRVRDDPDGEGHAVRETL